MKINRPDMENKVICLDYVNPGDVIRPRCTAGYYIVVKNSTAAVGFRDIPVVDLDTGDGYHWSPDTKVVLVEVELNIIADAQSRFELR